MIEKRFDQQITFIYVQDLAISQSFYENLLGLDLILDQGACRIVKTSGDAYGMNIYWKIKLFYLILQS